MNNPFTAELDRTLTDFARNSSDEELRRAFQEAEYDLFSQVEEPDCYVMRDMNLRAPIRATQLVMGEFEFASMMVVSGRISEVTGAIAADHLVLALAA